MIIKIAGTVISSPFGAIEGRDHHHTGIDIPLEKGTVLQSVSDGIVVKVFDGSGDIGKGVAIKTDSGTHIFGHMDQTVVDVGDKLTAGDIIGTSGNTGHVIGENGGYHLHFAIQNPAGTFADPTAFADDIGAMGGLDDGGGIGGVIMDKFNEFSDFVIGKEVEFIFKPFMMGIAEMGSNMWQWFILNLPDLMGYATMGAGAFMILGAMIGKSGMLKPLGIYVGMLILALCILSGVKA